MTTSAALIKYADRWAVEDPVLDYIILRHDAAMYQQMMAKDEDTEETVEQQQAQNANYSGWTLVELFGHGHEAGFITTKYFGDKCMFQIDIPEIPEREETTDRPRWIDEKLCPEGTVVKALAIPGRTSFINPGAIYRMTPATEDAVRIAIARGVQRDIKIVSVPVDANRQLPGEPVDADFDEDEVATSQE